MITRVKLSTIEQGLPKYRSMLAGNAAYIPSSFDSIASATGTGSASTLTLSSIPGTYQHLQVRFMVLGTTNAGTTAYIQFNSDTTFGNYARHRLIGDGTTVASAGGTSSLISVGGWQIGTQTDKPIVGIIDIHDYASTSKYKTVRVFAGQDCNGSGSAELFSGLWMSTSAITSITLTASTLTTTSTAALYGIKGA